MEILQLFLKVQKPALTNEWNEKVDSSIKRLAGVEQVMLIENNADEDAQINIGYYLQETSLDKIASIVEDTGAVIDEINIHFPPAVSGVSDAYGASAVSLDLDRSINAISGIMGVSISSNGIIKVSIDPKLKNKETCIGEIIKTIHH
jgi:hypothetical protein